MRADRNSADEAASENGGRLARPEDSDRALPEPPPEGDSPLDGGPDPGSEHHRHHLPHPHLIEPEEDRWKWRAKIRRDPRKLFFYRIGVGLAGLLLVIAAVISGPFPGPGGIPLFLLGMAVWSSEFQWAHNVMLRFKGLVGRYLGWSRSRRIGFWVLVILGIWSIGYVTMVVSGIPPWVPGWVTDRLSLLPGLS